MNKTLLKKLLSLSIIGGLFFTGCEDDDEGFNNGDLVGQWKITYYYAKRERTVALPADVAAGTRYNFFFQWKDVDAFKAATGTTNLDANGNGINDINEGTNIPLFNVGDGDMLLGYPQTLEYSETTTPSLEQLNVKITLTLDDAPSKGLPAAYLIEGTYPSYIFDEKACNTSVSIAPITDVGLYTPDVTSDGTEKLGNLIIEPDPNKGGNVLPPFADGTFSITPAATDADVDEASIQYIDRNGHDEKYKEVKTTWSEKDDRVIQGYGFAFVDDDQNLLASGGNTAQPESSEGWVNINKLAKSAGQSTDVGETWGGYQTWYFFNVMAAYTAQLTDVKAPLKDSTGKTLADGGSPTVTDMIVFMHSDNLAGGGGKTAFGMPYSVLIDSSNPLAPAPRNDSAGEFSLANMGAGGKMRYTVPGVCVPTNEIVDVRSKWDRVVE